MMRILKWIPLVLLSVISVVAALLLFWGEGFVTWGFLVPIGFALGAVLALWGWPWPSTQPNHTTTSPLFVAILLGAGLLLFTSLLYQAERDYQERVFARPTIVAFDGFEARITYPEVIQHEPPDKLGLPLTVELLRTAVPSPTP